ncbi:MAG TPA: retroviral-like aspartic protease family protein [Thermoanaerobaculia bacterium]|nr:retroviral-like aspartic protease family protein [Thermoanaerobaculia bacterium]
MGAVRASVLLENGGDVELVERGMLPSSSIRRVEADMLVDTGAVVVLLPQDMVEALGLRLGRKVVVVMANDQKTEMTFANGLSLTFGDRTMTTDCLVGPPRCEPLLGQVVLEQLDLIVHPTRQQLIVNPESPFLPMLPLK